MDEDLTIPHHSAKNCNISVIEDEKEKVKDFVYKHFRDGTDGTLFSGSEESPVKDHGSSNKEDKQTLNKAHCKFQQRAVFSGKILSFGCSVCKDDSTYSPNDLLKHFRVTHKGTLPTYPCDLCGFVTNEFPSLQRHRIEHRNTLVTCELCSDGVQYSLHLLTRHYIMCHSVNGQFHCHWCDFMTVDAGTFVQHIHHHNESPWKCSRCLHISLNEEDHQRHMKAHVGTFPFTCQVCGYGAARSELLKKHMNAVHKEESERRNGWKAVEEGGTPAASSASVKPVMKKSCESQEAVRMSKVNCLSGSLPNQNGKSIKADVSLEDTPHFADWTTVKRDKNCSKGSHNAEQSTPAVFQDYDSFVNSDAASHSCPNGLTVLMVKNKISLPPHCTTKVMGFKIVDGKKHLVLKVIPTAKQDVCSPNHPSVEGFPAAGALLDKSKVFDENGECSDSDGSPRSGSSLQADDIMAVKVKIEEEETSVCNFDSVLRRDDVGEQNNGSIHRSSSAHTFYPLTDEFDHMGDQSQLSPTTCPETGLVGHNSTLASSNSYTIGYSSFKITNTLTGCTSKVAALPSPSFVAKETLLSKPLYKNIVLSCGAEDETSMTDTEGEGNSSIDTVGDDRPSHGSPHNTDRIRTEVKDQTSQQKVKKLLTDVVTPSGSASSTSTRCRDSPVGPENYTKSSPNQEVFLFHNYSKETFSTLPNTNQNVDNMSESSADKDSICGSTQFSLTLAESPEPFTESGSRDYSIQEKKKKLSESDSEDECISSLYDPSTEDENPESVLQDFNIIKIEEESIPVSKTQSEMKNSSSSPGSLVEDHSNAIITKQLKEIIEPSSASSDSSKPPKTTLRLLQLPEGQQPVLLRATDNHFAMPMQVKASTPGFKLITNSTNPQINVSYLKSGIERSSNPSSAAVSPNSPNSRRTAASAPKVGAVDKGTTLLSAFQTGVSTTSSHYLINSPGLKGPVLLSSTAHNATDKAAKTQQTCYLVQRSVPLAQSAPGLRLAGSQLPLTSRPVLAMPVSSADKPSALQAGRQAFLLRYISPPKSTLLLNNQDKKPGTQCGQTAESNGNKVIFKIVTPTGNILTSGAPSSASQPLFLATRPQCFLLSSNKTNGAASNRVKKMISIQSSAQKDVSEPCVLPSQMTVSVKQSETERPILAPRPIRPPSQRKRRRKQLFDELPATVYKARRLSNKVLSDKETTVFWKPVAKDTERTLRLAPFSSLQQIKCPRRYQPVVVLNHPDADIPEVANIMKIVSQYRGAVTKVSLSQKTIQALCELSASGRKSFTKGASRQSDEPRPRPVRSSVRERFLLKMKLRKKSKRKYEVVDSLSGLRPETVVFDCWFCGRLFNSQEDWIGHGQRHLMEATRDWNQLF